MNNPEPSAPESPAKEQPGERNDVANMVEWLKEEAEWRNVHAGHNGFTEESAAEQQAERAQFLKAAALLAKLGQGWIPEPVAWRREWDGDVSDIGAMLYASSPDELDEPLSRWQPLYAREPESE